MWIPEVSARGWVILTLDARLRYRPGEKSALRFYKARVLLFAQPKNPGPDWLLSLAEEFAEAQERITHFLERTPPPFVAWFHVESRKKGSKRYRLSKLNL